MTYRYSKQEYYFKVNFERSNKRNLFSYERNIKEFFFNN